MSIYKNKSLLIIAFILPALFIFISCSNDKGVEPVQPAVVKIIVKSGVDSSVVSGANVVLYNANNSEAISRHSSGSDGSATFNDLSAGSFYVRIAAQGFHELPEGSISPIPFSAAAGQTYSQTYYLDTLLGILGTIDGTITPVQAGFLIVAASTATGAEYHTYSGPDGYFALFNVPFGQYDVYGVKAGYNSDNKQVTISPEFPSKTIRLTFTQVTGSTLSGMVTFLATQNGIVDISILDKNSHSVVTGLTTKIDSNRNYTISNIPTGEYIAWASYENDTYVMDPDWIFKNPGALNISLTSDTALSLDFSVTDAIRIISPTNPNDSIVPAQVDTTVPTFRWDPYPQAKEYIIEVRDINGNLIWGGFTASGVIRHTQIARDQTSAVFNFDGSAFSPLQPGEIYQWKIYADDDDAANVQVLLSSSEDLKGIFIINN